MTYEILEKYKKIIGSDPVTVIRATIAPLVMCMPWNTKEHPLHSLMITRGRDTLLSINETQYFALAIDRFRQYNEGKISIKELEEEYSRYEVFTQQLYDEVIKKDLSLLTDLELQGYLRVINETVIPNLLRTIYIETVDYDKVLSVIGTENKEKLDSVWENATKPNFVSFEGRYLQKQIELLSDESENIIRKAKFMFTDYFWTKNDEEILKALNEIRDNLIEKKREAQGVHEEMCEQSQVHMTWQETLDPDSKRLVEYLQLVMRLRDIRKDPIAQMLAIIVEIVTVMAKRAEIELRLAPYLLLHECSKGVEYLKSIRDDVQMRDQGYLYLANPDHSYELSPCDFEDAVIQFTDWTKHHIHHTNEIRGQIACRGLVRGTVRIIIDPYDDKGFQDGDVLVASMTRPEFVPLMKRAGAVVTSEGGITCHAAIVSRELKIPCIIGTKIATQVLKDGDLVEVDADNGVVRVLERV